jgi:tetratricopeptide (TPR) repeat protein
MLRNLIFILLFSSCLLLSQDDFNNRFMLANSFEQSGEYVKAKNILEDLFVKNPASYQVFEALNRVYIQLKDYEGSERIINSRIAANPGDVNMYGLLGKTYHIQGDEKKAFETWDKALEAGAGNLSFYRVIANYAIDRRAFGKALEVLNKAKDKAPDPTSFSMEVANLYALTMNYTKAAEEYISVLRNVPTYMTTVRGRITSFINKPEALNAILRTFKAEKNPNSEIKSILAWLYIENKNFKEAHKLYAELDAERGNNGGDIHNYAQMLYSIKEYEAAAEVFMNLITTRTASPLVNSAKMGYAKSMEEILGRKVKSSGKNWKPVTKTEDLNFEETKKLLEIYADISRIGAAGGNDLTKEALYRAGRIHLKYKNQADKAEEFFTEILKTPVSAFAPDAALDLGYIEIKRGNPDKALSYLEKVAQYPRSVDEQKTRAKLMMAEIHFYKKQFDNSQKLLSDITVNLKDNNANDAIELSLLLNTKMNDSLSLLSYAEAEFLSAQERFSEAREKYAEISPEKGGIMLGNLSQLKLAETELALDNTERSVEILEQISGEESRNIYSDKALYLLGNIFEYGLNEPERALEIYEKLLARFPASMYLDEAREQIIKLKNKLS